MTFRTRPDLLWVHPASHTMRNGSFPCVKRLEIGVNHPSHLASRLNKEQCYTSTHPLLTTLLTSTPSKHVVVWTVPTLLRFLLLLCFVASVRILICDIKNLLQCSMHSYVLIKEGESSVSTILSIGDNQLHVSAIYSHLQAEFRFIISENV